VRPRRRGDAARAEPAASCGPRSRRHGRCCEGTHIRMHTEPGAGLASSPRAMRSPRVSCVHHPSPRSACQLNRDFPHHPLLFAQALIAGSVALSPDAMLFSDTENAIPRRRTLDERPRVGRRLAIVTIDRPHARTPSRWRRWTSWRRRSTGRGCAALVMTVRRPRVCVGRATSRNSAHCAPNSKRRLWRSEMRSICDRIAGFPTPTIAVLNGHVLGGGAEFAVAPTSGSRR